MNQIFIDEMLDNIDKNYLSSFYKDNIFELSFYFKSDFKNTKYLRDYLIYIIDIIGLENIRKNRFILIVDELSNNAIEYGSSSESINIMRFISKKVDDNIYINIEIEDAGNGKFPKKAKEMENLREDRLKAGFENHKSIRGRGLFLIITKLVDELYFKDSQKGGLIVGIKKTLKTNSL